MQSIAEIVRELTTWPRCQGDKWIRRWIPHPYLHPSEQIEIAVSRVCPFCDGKGQFPLQTALNFGTDPDLRFERDKPLTAKEKRF
jgi:hypothetical protein